MSRRVPIWVTSNVCGHQRLVKISSGKNEMELRQARERMCSDCRYAPAWRVDPEPEIACAALPAPVAQAVRV